MRQTTSSEFRDIILRTYPGIDKDVSYWRFMQYLLFGRKDKVNGCPVISQHQVAKAEGKLEIARESTNYNAAKFLLSFQSIVMGEDAFQWSGWSFKEGLARTALVKFTPEVEQALELERYNFMNTETRVYFETGDKYSPRLEKLSRDLIKAEANTYLDLCAPEARELAEYLNDLPVNSFTKVIQANLNETIAFPSLVRYSNNNE